MYKKTILIILVVAVLALAVVFGYYFTQVNSSASDSAEEVVFTIQEGEGVKEIADNLKSAGLIKNSYIFEWYVYFDNSQSKFMAGDYDLSPSQNVKELVTLMTSGESQIENRITILEGWTSEEIDNYLSGEGIITSGDFLSAAQTTEVSEIIPGAAYAFLSDKPDDQGLEGYLFPDTYRIFRDATPANIIEKMLDNFKIKFTDQMKADAEAGNMSIYEIVTLASIIEKEVSLDRDRRIVAGIFYNRLNNNIGLQSDATVNYVTNGDRPQPTAEDLEVDSPYNTYKYRGLPPGPISNPSLSAIMAAIYPEKTDYYYFLNDINGDGSTIFSKTYEEHVANKAEYLN